MSEPKSELPTVPSDADLLNEVLARVAVIAEEVRAIRGLALAVGLRLQGNSDESHDSEILINRCTQLLEYLEPMRRAAKTSATPAAAPQPEADLKTTLH